MCADLQSVVKDLVEPHLAGNLHRRRTVIHVAWSWLSTKGSICNRLVAVQAGFEPEAPSSPNIPRSALSFSRNSGESRHQRIRSPIIQPEDIVNGRDMTSRIHAREAQLASVVQFTTNMPFFLRAIGLYSA